MSGIQPAAAPPPLQPLPEPPPQQAPPTATAAAAAAVPVDYLWQLGFNVFLVVACAVFFYLAVTRFWRAAGERWRHFMYGANQHRLAEHTDSAKEFAPDLRRLGEQPPPVRRR